MPRGGARPGAGRKRTDTKAKQLSNREIVLASVDREALVGAVKSMIAKAQSGDAKAFAVIAPYLLGSPTQEVELTGADGGPIEVTLSDEARAERILAIVQRARERAAVPADAAKPDLDTTAGATN